MKKKIIVLSLIVICLSLMIYGSLAYFTAEDTANNVITTGGIEIELQEWADLGKTQPFPKAGVDGVMPGMRVTKIVEVKNTGSSDAYVRVKATVNIVLADNTTASDTSYVGLDFNAADWELKDGFYYFKRALKPGETSTPLFTELVLDADMDNIYQNSKVTVEVVAFATQAANNGLDPMTAKGWPGA